MQLSVVRIHKASVSGGQPWVQARPVVDPEKYLSQCPFILLNEESYAPLSEFAIRSHGGVLAMTLVLDGSVEQTDGTGVRWRLGQGDADFSTGRGGVLRGVTSSELGVKFLHLWVNLPATLEPDQTRRQIVRHADAHRTTFGDATALLYAGNLGAAAVPRSPPWPITVVDLSIQAGKQAALPLASAERSFAYILGGEIELGRNQVRLNRGNVAWIERTVGTDDLNALTVRARKDTRILLFSSPVFGDGASAASGNGADCAPSPTLALPF